ARRSPPGGRRTTGARKERRRPTLHRTAACPGPGRVRGGTGAGRGGEQRGREWDDAFTASTRTSARGGAGRIQGSNGPQALKVSGNVPAVRPHCQASAQAA